jgi:DNA-directed RNA polymerase alpha subunit
MEVAASRNLAKLLRSSADSIDALCDHVEGLEASLDPKGGQLLLDAVGPLSVRSEKALEQMGIRTVHDARKKMLSADEIICLPHVGETTLRELRDALGTIGIELKDHEEPGR